MVTPNLGLKKGEKNENILPAMKKYDIVKQRISEVVGLRVHVLAISKY